MKNGPTAAAASGKQSLGRGPHAKGEVLSAAAGLEKKCPMVKVWPPRPASFTQHLQQEGSASGYRHSPENEAVLLPTDSKG